MNSPVSPKAKKRISRDDDYRSPEGRHSPDRRPSPLSRSRTASPDSKPKAGNAGREARTVARKGSALPGFPYKNDGATYRNDSRSNSPLREQSPPRGKALSATEANGEWGTQQAQSTGKKAPKAHAVSHGVSKMEAVFPPKGKQAGKYHINYGASKMEAVARTSREPQARPLHRSPTDSPAASPRTQMKEVTATPSAPTAEGIAPHKDTAGIRLGQQSAQRITTRAPGLPPSSGKRAWYTHADCS